MGSTQRTEVSPCATHTGISDSDVDGGDEGSLVLY